MPARPASPALAALLGALWPVFLAWSVLVLALWCSTIGEAEVIAWTERALHLPPAVVGQPRTPLQEGLIGMLTLLDAVWVLLAMANVHRFTAQREGAAVARRWLYLSLGAVFAVALGARLAGLIRYTTLFGPRFLSVPICLPLFWYAALIGARELVLRLRPSMAQAPLAFATGSLMLLLDLFVEPIARRHRVWWLADTAPWQSHAAWLVLGIALTWCLREERVASGPRRGLAVYLVILAVFVFARLWLGLAAK